MGGKTNEELKKELGSITVVKANEFVEKAMYDLSATEQQIVLYLIANVNSIKDNDLYEMTFEITDFCKIAGIQEVGGSEYTHLKAAVTSLKNKWWWMDVEKPDGKIERTTFDWISKARISPKSGKITIKLDEELKPYLLDMNEHFTKYELVWTIQFRSKYSRPLYEYIAHRHYHRDEGYTFDITVDELRRVMKVGEKQYPDYCNFKTRCLKEALEDINKFSDRNVKAQEWKIGRKVVKLSFTVSTKEPWDRQNIYDDACRAMNIDPDQMVMGEAF